MIKPLEIFGLVGKKIKGVPTGVKTHGNIEYIFFIHFPKIYPIRQGKKYSKTIDFFGDKLRFSVYNEKNIMEGDY